MKGAGRYDDECSAVRLATDAEGAIVIVIDGKKGSGFSVQTSEALALNLPQLLRRLADIIETDVETPAGHA
jgi:hypothetical protein